MRLAKRKRVCSEPPGARGNPREVSIALKNSQRLICLREKVASSKRVKNAGGKRQKRQNQKRVGEAKFEVELQVTRASQTLPAGLCSYRMGARQLKRQQKPGPRVL